MAHNHLLVYPNFIKEFKNHTNASNLQLGVVIFQEEKMIAVYSRTLNYPQIGIW